MTQHVACLVRWAVGTCLPLILAFGLVLALIPVSPHSAFATSQTLAVNIAAHPTPVPTSTNGCPHIGGANFTLRCAILWANADCASATTSCDTMDFAIPSSDTRCHTTTLNGNHTKIVCTITPASAFPTLNAKFVTVNGYTQLGASLNTLSTGDNTILTINVDGGAAVPRSRD